MKRPAIFLDRDGTLIEDRGYIQSVKDIHFLPGVFDALRRIKNRYLLFIITNQPGISQGYISPKEVKIINDFITTTLAREEIYLHKIYVCPHRREDNCACIKPKPYFLLKAAREFDIDLHSSYVIGDHPSDMELAKAGGASGIYVLTGHGSIHRGELTSYFPVVANLPEAVDLIIKEEKAVKKAALIIQQGGVIVFPTETVYGLGADAFNPLAVARVFEIKARPHFDPLIVHIARMEELKRLVEKIPAQARHLATRFWPGPLTIVLPKKKEVPEIVTSGLASVAIRMPRHNLTLKLIQQASTPIVGPSANPFGYLSPTTAQHVSEQLGGKVDFILDGGPCEVGVESTIISFLDDPPRLLRPGGIPLEDIEAIIGRVAVPRGIMEKPQAPGMLPRHYSPRTPILLQWTEEDFWRWKKEGKRIGLLSFQGGKFSLPLDQKEILSPRGELREAAANFFSALHRLDKAKLDLILAEEIPETGVGRAIMDRLRRASVSEAKKPEPDAFRSFP